VTPPSTTLFSALEQQLGLKLQPQTSPVEVLVIDHAEKVIGETASEIPVRGVTSPPFEVISILPSPAVNEGMIVRFVPGNLTLTNWTPKALIAYAYNLPPNRIMGGPSWIGSEKFLIDAKVNDSLAYEAGKLVEFNATGGFPPGLRHDQLRLALQSLLRDRFSLQVSRESQERPIFALTVARKNSALREADPGETYSSGIVSVDGHPAGPGRAVGQNGHLAVQALPMSTVADILSVQLDRSVQDKTGLRGNYDFPLNWTPAPSGSQIASLSAALQDQLGLQLESQKSSVDVLVIRTAQKPSDN
jgi:uncharacterized protein (TIGR03435 family)